MWQQMKLYKHILSLGDQMAEQILFAVAYAWNENFDLQKYL